MTFNADACQGKFPLKPRINKTKKEKKENENKRSLYLKVRVIPEEMNTIKCKFQNSGMETLSGFVFAMIFEGYIVQIDKDELNKIGQAANNASNNINQIAIRANSTGDVYPEDIAEVKDLAHQIIQPLLFLQTKVLQLKH